MIRRSWSPLTQGAFQDRGKGGIKALAVRLVKVGAMAFPEIDFLAFKEECLSIRSEVSRRRLGHEFGNLNFGDASEPIRSGHGDVLTQVIAWVAASGRLLQLLASNTPSRTHAELKNGRLIIRVGDAPTSRTSQLSEEFPAESLFIRSARMSVAAIGEWFNADGTPTNVMNTAGASYTTSLDEFYLGDLRVSGDADIEIAQVAVYTTALTESQIMGLSAGVLDRIDNGMTGGGGTAEITGVSRSAVGVSLVLPEGTTYDIEYSLDLINWDLIAYDVTGSYDDTDVTRAAAANGFYRGILK